MNLLHPLELLLVIEGEYASCLLGLKRFYERALSNGNELA